MYLVREECIGAGEDMAMEGGDGDPCARARRRRWRNCLKWDDLKEEEVSRFALFTVQRRPSMAVVRWVFVDLLCAVVLGSGTALQLLYFRLPVQVHSWSISSPNALLVL